MQAGPKSARRSLPHFPAATAVLNTQGGYVSFRTFAVAVGRSMSAGRAVAALGTGHLAPEALVARCEVVDAAARARPVARPFSATAHGRRAAGAPWRTAVAPWRAVRRAAVAASRRTAVAVVSSVPAAAIAAVAPAWRPPAWAWARAAAAEALVARGVIVHSAFWARPVAVAPVPAAAVAPVPAALLWCAALETGMAGREVVDAAARAVPITRTLLPRAAASRLPTPACSHTPPVSRFSAPADPPTQMTDSKAPFAAAPFRSLPYSLQSSIPPPPRARPFPLPPSLRHYSFAFGLWSFRTLPGKPQQKAPLQQPHPTRV